MSFAPTRTPESEPGAPTQDARSTLAAIATTLDTRSPLLIRLFPPPFRDLRSPGQPMLSCRCAARVDDPSGAGKLYPPQNGGSIASPRARAVTYRCRWFLRAHAACLQNGERRCAR